MTGPLSAPWTEIGRCQTDISRLEAEVRRKADDHEIHALSRRVDSMEHTVRELSSTLDGIQSRLSELEAEKRWDDER